MLTLAHNKQSKNDGFNPHNSFRLTVLLLSILTFISVVASCFFNFPVSSPKLYLLALMLFPMSHLFNTYNSILQVRIAKGLTTKEIHRLTYIINRRTDSLFKIMLLYLGIICLIATLSVTNVIDPLLTLMLSITIIVVSLVDTALAWTAIKEIRDVECKLHIRVNRDEARAKIKKQANSASEED